MTVPAPLGSREQALREERTENKIDYTEIPPLIGSSNVLPLV